MPLRTTNFLADKALWLRSLFYNHLGLQRAFMGTPYSPRPPPQDGTINDAFMFRTLHQRPQDPDMKVALISWAT